ncbi:MAG TPA: hypothetical protein P5026_14225 [Kiritimatiellia bacterium]|nr:hypothetical protein [Kiritimatiellia bacterium]HRU71824.1 hypothetical protein [Kiritimatiellia bacterium]
MKQMLMIFFAVAFAASVADAALADAKEIRLEGVYKGHLQDVWWDGGTNLWWAHTGQILRTDTTGRIITQVHVKEHNAGCEVRDGKLYVAVCLMQNKTGGKTTPECRVQVNVHDALSLKLLEEHVLDINDRAGSLAILPDGSFVVGCLRPPDIALTQVRLHHISPDFKLISSHVIDNVQVKLGIETIKYHNGELYLHMYAAGGLTVVLDPTTFKEKRRFCRNGAYGLIFDGEQVWRGISIRNQTDKTYTSKLVCEPLAEPAIMDAK